jgi:hypothetical protein
MLIYHQLGATSASVTKQPRTLAAIVVISCGRLHVDENSAKKALHKRRQSHVLRISSSSTQCRWVFFWFVVVKGKALTNTRLAGKYTRAMRLAIRMARESAKFCFAMMLIA